MTVSIIIPNYNGEELLRKNLPKVIKSSLAFARDKNHRVEIFVVDDFSTDKSQEVVEKFIEQSSYSFCIIKLFKNVTNRGFSSTVNRGVSEAKGEILVLLNTDAYPEKSELFLAATIHHFNTPDFFAVGFMDKSIEEDGSIVLRGRGVGKWSRGFLVHERGKTDKENTLWVSGGSGAYRKSIWDRLGGMNVIYDPFYWEDVDLSYRALKSGYGIAFDKECVVVHEHERGSIKKSRSPFVVRKIAYRNQILFVWLNVTDWKIFFSHIFWLPFHLVNTLVQGDTAFFLGFFQAITKLHTVLAQRRKVRRFFKRTDEEVVKEFSDSH